MGGAREVGPEAAAYASALRAAVNDFITRGGTQKEIATATNFAPSTLSRYLSGERTAPSGFVAALDIFLTERGKALEAEGRARLDELCRLAHEASGSPAVRLAYLEDLRHMAVPPMAGRPARVTSQRPGWPVRHARDPFDLEVHRAIDVSGNDASSPLPVLPVYVEREHDAPLHEAVLGALDGRSALVTLVGGSSTGKTRACWEAVRLLPDEWYLWHPIAPSHPDAVLAGLAAVEPHTVLWLNEIQQYLLTIDPSVGERVAAGLRELLRTPGRGPVLALATTNLGDWDRLTTSAPPHDGYTQARALLTGVGVHARVPDQFVCDPLALEEAAQADPRVAEASAGAVDGRLTQYLAGVPALLDRVEHAVPMAQYLVMAAVQLRRLGHSPMLPLRVLEPTAVSLAPDHVWDAHAPGWFESALAYLSAPCRGVPGPLSKVWPRPGTPRSDQPLYRLSDYLFEAGRYEFRHDCPSARFWSAALQHAHTDEDRRGLARSAYARGRLRVSASVSDGTDLFGLYDRGSSYRLGKKADRARAESALATIGERRTSGELERIPVLAYFYRPQEAHHLAEIGELEQATAVWRELAEQGHLDAFVNVGHHHLELGERAEAERWFRLGAEAGEDDAMQELVFMLSEDGLFEKAAIWTERIAKSGRGDIYAYSRLAYRFERAGDLVQAKICFRNAIDVGLVDCYQDLVRLHYQEGDMEGARRLCAEAIEAGETTGPMMQAEKADALAFTARDHGRTVQPLRRLLWHRLQEPDNIALGTALARTAIDSGEAFIVAAVASELSEAGYDLAVEALQQLFDEVDEILEQ